MRSWSKTTLFALLVAFPLAGCTVEQTEEGEMPDVDVSMEEGKLPEYDVDAADVDIKGEKRTVTVPDVDVDAEERQVTVPDVDVTMPDEQGEAEERLGAEDADEDEDDQPRS